LSQSNIVLTGPTGVISEGSGAIKTTDGQQKIILSPTTSLPEGDYLMDIVFYDAEGKSVSDQISFKIDSDVPALTMISPFVYPLVEVKPGDNERQQRFKGSFSSATHITDSNLIVNGVIFDLGVAGRGGSFDATKHLEEGENSIIIEAKNVGSGNKFYTGEMIFTVDSVPPEAHISVEGAESSSAEPCGDGICVYGELPGVGCFSDCLIERNIGVYTYDSNSVYEEEDFLLDVDGNPSELYALSYLDETNIVVAEIHESSDSVLYTFSTVWLPELEQDSDDGFIEELELMDINGHSIYSYVIPGTGTTFVWVSSNKFIEVINQIIGSEVPEAILDAYLTKYPSTIP